MLAFNSQVECQQEYPISKLGSKESSKKFVLKGLPPKVPVDEIQLKLAQAKITTKDMKRMTYKKRPSCELKHPHSPPQKTRKASVAEKIFKK